VAFNLFSPYMCQGKGNPPLDTLTTLKKARLIIRKERGVRQKLPHFLSTTKLNIAKLLSLFNILLSYSSFVFRARFVHWLFIHTSETKNNCPSHEQAYPAENDVMAEYLPRMLSWNGKKSSTQVKTHFSLLEPLCLKPSCSPLSLQTTGERSFEPLPAAQAPWSALQRLLEYQKPTY
jgi:hypothetical protein